MADPRHPLFSGNKNPVRLALHRVFFCLFEIGFECCGPFASNAFQNVGASLLAKGPARPAKI
jgi:hypothetical protein